MRRFLLSLIFLCFCGTALAAAFPALTGRVVDNAHLLSATTIQNLDRSLAAFEQQSTDQIVVVTIPSLQGQPIEDYGYQLGRHWGIGQKGKDNGVLLIVAPSEHKTRIEVGYGLEGTLTDAAANQIIQTVILPDFRRAQMEQGIVDGTNAIIATLGGTNVVAAGASSYAPTQSTTTGGDLSSFVLIMLIFAWVFLRIFILPWRFPSFFPFSGGGGGFGGGFSGGGGSFGGGGASGGW